MHARTFSGGARVDPAALAGRFAADISALDMELQLEALANVGDVTVTRKVKENGYSWIVVFLDQLGNQRLAFVIGGADGLTNELKGRAHWQLSLSPMTFPHELARLMLIEQLFRAQAILQGSPYHRA